MSKKEEFSQRIANYTPAQPKDAAYQTEVAEVERYFHNCLDGSNFGSRTSTKCYSRDFIQDVIKLAQQIEGHSVPSAIYNLKSRKDQRQVLWFTFDITRIPYLCDYYDFVSEADALECKRQLQELNKQMSQKENPERRTVIPLLNKNFKMFFRGGIGGMRFNHGQALLAVQGNLRFGKRMGFIQKKQMIIWLILHAPDDSPENRNSLLRRK